MGLSTVDGMTAHHAAEPWPKALVSVGEIDRLKQLVADREQEFGISSEAMFEGDHPRVAELSETAELDEWASAWYTVSALPEA